MPQTLKKTPVKINERGDIIDSFEEKRVIEQAQEEFVIPETTGTPLPTPEIPKPNKLESMIEDKITKMVEKKIEEVLNKIM